MVIRLLESFIKYEFYKRFISKTNNDFKALDLTSKVIVAQILTEGFYEKYILEFIKSNFYEYDDTFVDVGANIGNHSIFFSKYFKNVVSIEPSKFNFKLLKLNAGKLSNVELFNCGCSNQNKNSKLYFNRNSYSGMSIYPPSFEDSKKRNLEKLHDNIVKNSQQEIETIKLIKLDDLIYQKYKKISLIKFDVEGEELKCLQGASKIIKRDGPIIIFEEWSLINGNSQFIEQLKVMDNSYKFYYLKENNFFNKRFLKFIYKIFFKKKYTLTEINKETGGFETLFAIKNKNIVNLKK